MSIPRDERKVLLITIPCSGTCFWQKLIYDHGVRVTRYHTIDYHRSLYTSLLDDPEYVLVTTYRDMDKIMHTWDTVDIGYDKLTCIKNWHRLLAYNPIIVSVDTNREASLQVLSDALGIELKTDWTPVNARSEHKLELQRNK